MILVMKFQGKVIAGDAIGAKFGIATANLEIDKKFIPSPGVYLISIKVLEQIHEGLLHVGERKTFGGSFSVEAHIFDFSKNIYGEIIKIEILKYLRPTQCFQNSDALFTQISTDMVKARKFFLRRKTLQTWKTISPKAREALAKKAIEKITKLPEFKSATNVLSFAPLSTEIPFIETLCAQFPEKKFFFPKIVNKSMQFVLSKFSELRPGKYNILEPDKGEAIALSSIDLAFIPAVSADSRNHRLGRGGGFYDKVLGDIAAPKIVILPEFAKVESVPTQKHDEKVDVVIYV